MSDKDDIRSNDLEEYGRYLDERRALNGARFKVADSLDKAILTF